MDYLTGLKDLFFMAITVSISFLFLLYSFFHLILLYLKLLFLKVVRVIISILVEYHHKYFKKLSHFMIAK